MANQTNKSRYTCPMHSEIIADKPGRCPKCGMALTAPDAQAVSTYGPLIIIFSLIFIASLVASLKSGQFSWNNLILNFMTGFFLVFAGFKLMDLKGFAEGYSTYDLLARRLFFYGHLYPFIELAFGLLMLSGYHPDWLLWTEFGVMIFSGLGVALKLTKREPFTCACLGTFLKIPLTYVTLIEDFGMAILAIALIWWK